MKYRKDFVTNSSSSSYVCDICGYDESGYDMGLSEAGMIQCVNGHTFCEHHVKLDDDKIALLLTKMQQDDEEYNQKLTEMDANDLLREYLCEYDGRYEAAEFLCPICSFEHGYSDDVVKYLEIKYHITDKDILKELKDKFKDYESFKAFLKGK